MAKIVLVVEDDPKISKLIREMLERESYTAIAAIDGRQG
jgi:DNA-binding response OmpR family regulator